MKYLYLIILLCLSYHTKANFFQQDTSSANTVRVYSTIKLSALDSANLSRKVFLRDSLTYAYLHPNPNRQNLFTDSLLKEVIITDRYLLTPAKSIKIKKNKFGYGIEKNSSPLWFLIISTLLITFFGIIKIVFKKEVDLIFKAFFDNRTLNQINKEDNLFVSWQFLFLYITFAFTVGLFVCVIFYKTSVSEKAAEFSLFFLISLFAFIFFGLKILILRLLGFVFKVQKLVRDYTNIIYLTYFNVLFILLPLAFCLSLINITNQYYVFWAVLMLFSGIILFQFARITINILINYRLSKFYLILYLCALEICPILIFAKTINTSL